MGTQFNGRRLGWTNGTKQAALAAMAVSLLGAAGIAQASGPETVLTAYHTGYVPDGFDTNDRVEIVGEGIFPNTCFRPATPKVEVDHERKVVEVNSRAYEYSGFCLQMLVPYHQVLDLGLLKAGDYQIFQKDTADSLGQVKVRAATTSSPDDFLYAPVSQAFFKQTESKQTLTLTGKFTNSCMTLVDVVTHVQKNVITVQPIAELRDGTDCKVGEYPFERTVDVKGTSTGRFLVHVRSLNGQSVNTLVDIL